MKHNYFVSGGKDSVAMLLMAIEKGMPIDNVYFMDTEIEFPEMYSYLYRLEAHTGIKIQKIKSHFNFYTQFYKIHQRGKHVGKIWGFPRQALPCWIQRDLKKWDKIPDRDDSIKYIGIASDELHRTERKMYDETYKFPLIEWGMSEADCIEYLKERDLLNPLYDKFGRLGCWLCPRQKIGSLEMLYVHYPHLWEELLRLEGNSPHGFRTESHVYELDERFKEKYSENKN